MFRVEPEIIRFPIAVACREMVDLIHCHGLGGKGKKCLQEEDKE